MSIDSINATSQRFSKFATALSFDASIYRTELIGKWSVSRSDVLAVSRHFSFIAIGLINILSTSIRMIALAESGTRRSNS